MPIITYKVTSIILAAVTRAIVIGFVSTSFLFIVDLPIKILDISLRSFHFIGSIGFITGLWATKFDHTAIITNFIIQPLSFLSGVFYTIDKLPSVFHISQINPFFCIINIFRYGFT